MKASVLDTITTPADLKALSNDDLARLAVELRHEMVAATSVHGGHLASSLGAVELILAIHRVLDCPHDRIVFDVGHQAYAHKILTGRREGFKSLRTLGGLSGFPKIDESPYDSHDSGHASDALSTALGYALARDIDGDDSTIVALVGDASFTGGMSLEALNEIGQSGTKLIIILNDNGMSISVNVGGFSNFLSKVRLSEGWQEVRQEYNERWDQRGKLGKFVKHTSTVFRDSIKRMASPEGSPFFEGFGVTYVGPVDGHDLPLMESILKEAKDFDGPVLIHAVTTKGKGYVPAEERPDIFHGVGPFNPKTGEHLGKKSVAPSWTSVFSSQLIELAREHDDIVAITAAMPGGTGLAAFEKEFPKRFFDVGIAEQNAVGMSSSLAMAGKVPFVAIYSTFIQRAFDQLVINVALQKQHVVFCLDRAGLVGEDGPTHHGAFDLSFMRVIPGMTILAPSSDQELKEALVTAYGLEGPVCIRYPRGSAVMEQERPVSAWEHAKARKLRDGSDVVLLACGNMVHAALAAARLLAEDGIEASVWDARWVKPVDMDMLAMAAKYPLVATLEDNSVVGGFGSAVLEGFAQLGGAAPKTLTLGLPDDFVTQGPIRDLRVQLGIDPQGIADSVSEALKHEA